LIKFKFKGIDPESEKNLLKESEKVSETRCVICNERQEIKYYRQFHRIHEKCLY